jgi:hypothetical protein
LKFVTMGLPAGCAANRVCRMVIPDSIMIRTS